MFFNFLTLYLRSEKHIFSTKKKKKKKYRSEKQILAYRLVWVGEVLSYPTFALLMILLSMFIFIYFR